jgi:hypothetical protein
MQSKQHKLLAARGGMLRLKEFVAVALQAAAIRETVDDGGARVRTTALIAGARIPIQVDIGFGDSVTPGPLEIDYPTLLAGPAPRLRAYPVETVVAEKFEALVLLGMANSRLKDFYDLWLIAQTFTLREASLRDAVNRTFAHRGSKVPHDVPVGLSEDFAAYWGPQWRTFLSRERMAAAPVDLVAVLADLRRFLMPLTSPPQAACTWHPGGPWL